MTRFSSLAVAALIAALCSTSVMAQPINVDANSSSNSFAGAQTAGNITTFNSQNPLQAPGAIAPGLAAAGIETCTGSASGGISGPGFGISFGATKTEQGCEARLDSRTLFSMGLKDAAVYRLCTSPDMAMSLAYAGTPCPAEFYSARQQRALFPAAQSRPSAQVLTRQSTQRPLNELPVFSEAQAAAMVNGQSRRKYDPATNSWN